MSSDVEEGVYEMHLYSKTTENCKQCFVYLCKKRCNETLFAFLEDEKLRLRLRSVCSKTFLWKGSYRVKLVMKSGDFCDIKVFEKNKVDGMNFGEKKVFTLPECVGTSMKFTVNVINEENVVLLETDPFDVSLSQPLPLQESRPGVEHDDIPQAEDQYICIMLTVFILCISIMHQPFSFAGSEAHG